MNIGKKTKNIGRQGLVNNAKNTNRLLNWNFDANNFDIAQTGSGINVALRDRSPKMFDAVAVKPENLISDSAWHTLQFGQVETPYKCDIETFTHDRTALSDKILVNRWGKYYVNFRFATRYHTTNYPTLGLAPHETIYFNLTSYNNTALTNLYWQGAHSYHYPKTHTIDGVDYQHRTTSGLTWYQMGTITAIIEPTDLYKDADGKYNIGISYMIGDEDDDLANIVESITNLSIVHYPI